MKNPTFANRWNADLIDGYYQSWQEDPSSVDATWQAFFEGFELALSDDTAPPVVNNAKDSGSCSIIQARVIGAVYAFRSIGHTQAKVNPLYREVPKNPRLTLERLGLKDCDMNAVYDAGNFLGGGKKTLGEIIEALEDTYCGNMGVEYLHIQETSKRRWLQAQIEPSHNKPEFDRETKLHILNKIIQAETFETFLHTRFVGQKRFGLEGGETLIAALDLLIQEGPDEGIEEIIMGMAHRGRLNVLANTLGKAYEYMLHEFSENYIPETIHGDGDVKYHLGYDSITTNNKGQKVMLQLAANPSHLEAVNSIVEGRARARQRIIGDGERKRVLPLLIHGDAAFSGQGVVAEVLNFSQLPGYTTGGTVHIVINNQIGFTTDPSEGRSSLYCTDVAKMIEAPILHVNGDDPLSVARAMQLALKYRQQFSADVVVDMYCYRRHGHNEIDEPSFTQPLMYQDIKSHPLVSEVYSQSLIKSGDLKKEELEAMQEKHLKVLSDAYEKEKENDSQTSRRSGFAGSTAIYQPEYDFKTIRSNIGYVELEKTAKALTTLPKDFTPNPKIKRQLKTKWDAFKSGKGIDWAFAESLAWGTLMLEGTPIRISGQDSKRGTFSQRHAVLYDTKSRESYIPLMHMQDRKAMICAHNSLLSEAAVLGFDYGYSLDYPQMLCIWEAQFGDFANGAQVVIDQFISSSESKWQRISGLVMLLPHGYEGQGPEHSSARLERYLQLCAEDNLQVCNLSTPAQYYHALRRQMRRPFRKPLILMAPKSLLRHKSCVSDVEELEKGSFQCILDDPKPAEKPKRVVFCSGKVYYSLIEYQNRMNIDDVAIVRVEQLYPFHKEQFKEIYSKYADAKAIVWCQEEPKNMGAWTYMAPIIEELTGRKPEYSGRKPSASPATGSLAMHKKEQENLCKAALEE